MEMVLLTALGVGGATVIGAAIGFIFKNLSHKFSDYVLSFAAGIMLAAAVIGISFIIHHFSGNCKHLAHFFRISPLLRALRHPLGEARQTARGTQTRR